MRATGHQLHNDEDTFVFDKFDILFVAQRWAAWDPNA